MALFKCMVPLAWTGTQLAREGDVLDLDPALLYDENGKCEAWEPVDPAFAAPVPKLKAERKARAKAAPPAEAEVRREEEAEAEAEPVEDPAGVPY